MLAISFAVVTIPNHFLCVFFFFNGTATTEIYTLSLHDALPIYQPGGQHQVDAGFDPLQGPETAGGLVDRKSTRLNSRHLGISYAVFCLKQKIVAAVHRHEREVHVDEEVGLGRPPAQRDVLAVRGSPDQHVPVFFFFIVTAPTEIYTLSQHDALPI